MNTRISATEKQAVLVYFAEYPGCGLEHRIFDEEDICANGGIHAIEAELERTTDRFVRLGLIKAEKTGRGLVFNDEDLVALPTPIDDEWRIGRLSPAYGRNDLEQQIYISEKRAIQSLLAAWKYEDGDDFIAFAPKKVRVGCLASLASSLCAVGEAFDRVELTASKYWYDRNWKIPYPTDLILAEFALTVPIRLRWGHGKHLVVSDIKPVHCC